MTATMHTIVDLTRFLDSLQFTVRAKDTLERVVETGAALMVNQRWRIVRAIHPYAPSYWPVPDADMTDLLDECACKLASMEAAARTGHYTYDINRHIALRQAERALLTMIMAD